MTVQGHDGQFFRIGSKLDARDVAVCIKRKVHLAGYASLDVESMHAHLRIHFACLRILVFIKSRICLIFTPFGSHTLVPREAEHRHFALVEADVSQHLAVGTEVEGTVEAELFFIHPVRNTVQYLVVLSVLGHLRFTVAEEQLYQEDVVVAYEGNLEAVGRELRHLLRTVFRQRSQPVVLDIENIIFGRKRAPVNRFRLCLNQNLLFVGRHDIVVERLQ